MNIVVKMPNFRIKTGRIVNLGIRQVVGRGPKVTHSPTCIKIDTLTFNNDRVIARKRFKAFYNNVFYPSIAQAIGLLTRDVAEMQA